MTFTATSNQNHAVGLFVESMSRPTVLQRLLDNQPQHVKDEIQRRRELRDARRKAAIDALRPKLTPEFLSTLAEVSRITGATDEWGDVTVGVADVYGLAQVVNLPSLEPINFDEEQP